MVQENFSAQQLFSLLTEFTDATTYSSDVHDSNFTVYKDDDSKMVENELSQVFQGDN